MMGLLKRCKSCLHMSNLAEFHCRDPRIQDYYVSLYRKTIVLIPDLDQQMDEIINDPARLFKLTSAVSIIPMLGSKLTSMFQLAKAARNARSDDSGTVRYAAPGLVMENPKEPLQPPIPRQRTKADRGFNHPVLAELLCPRSILEQYKKD